VIDSVHITKIEDSDTVSKKTCLPHHEMESFARCPLEITFADTDATFKFKDDGEKTFAYTVSGDEITVIAIGALFSYKYQLITENLLRIDRNVSYVVDGISSVKEIYNYYGRRITNQ
jgi:hypothetical protein